MSQKSICRACACTETPLVSLFTYEIDNKAIKLMFISCTSIMVEENDELPIGLCNKCLEILLITNKFRNKCLENDAMFRKELKEENMKFNDLNVDEIESIEEMPSPIVKERKSDRAKAQCDQCGHLFTKTSSLKYHLRLHENDRKFDCSECDLSFINKSQLTVHFRKHSGYKPHKCNVCQKTFAKSSNLNVHVLTHVKTKKAFQCNVCPKRFAQFIHLINHQKLHTGARSYKCTQCERCFITKTHLKRHLNLHFNIKDFLCNHCGKSFTSQGDLTRHTTSIHREHTTTTKGYNN